MLGCRRHCCTESTGGCPLCSPEGELRVKVGMTQTLHGFPGLGDSQGNHSHRPFPALFLIMTGSASVGSGVSFQTGPGVCGWTFLDPKPSIIFFPSALLNWLSPYPAIVHLLDMQATPASPQFKPDGAAAGEHVTITVLSRGPSHLSFPPVFWAWPALARN